MVRSNFRTYSEEAGVRFWKGYGVAGGDGPAPDSEVVPYQFKWLVYTDEASNVITWRRSSAIPGPAPTPPTSLGSGGKVEKKRTETKRFTSLGNARPFKADAFPPPPEKVVVAPPEPVVPPTELQVVTQDLSKKLSGVAAAVNSVTLGVEGVITKEQGEQIIAQLEALNKSLKEVSKAEADEKAKDDKDRLEMEMMELVLIKLLES